MRKLLLAMMVAMFAIFLTACGGNEEVVQPEVAPVDTPAPTPEATDPGDEPAEDEVAPVATMGLGEEARNMTRAEILATIPDVTPHGQIIMSFNAQVTANILQGWDNPVSNARIRDLVGGLFLSTMASNMDREFFPNPMVTRNIDIRDNADGSRTYTFTIYTENRFSDGRFITAADYAGWAALALHPYWNNITDSAGGAIEIVGRDEFISGEADTLVGVRLYDDETFSVTMGAEWLPFIWEGPTFMNWFPMPMHAMLPEGTTVRDDGDGVFFDGLTEEGLIQTINGTDGDGFRFTHHVAVGPYTFESWDPSSFIAVLRANPYFAGTWDGYVPRIETLIITQRDMPVIVDSLALGEIDMVSGQGGGDVLNAAFEHLVGVTHNAIDYPRHGYGLLRFHVDHGPTQFAAVRQAIKWMIDRDEFAQQFTEGHGTVVQGAYALSMWWYPIALQRGMYDRIIHYTFNPEMAIRILEDAGWVLNGQGEPFVLGTDPVRYKDVTGMDLLWFGSEGTSDPSIFHVNGRDLMRLEIQWATFNVNRITDIVNMLVAPELPTIGILLTPTLFDNALAPMARAGGAEPEFHMFNLGSNFALVYSPWAQANPDPAFLGGGFNTTFNRDYELFEMANRLRFMNLDTEEGRLEFVDAWIDMIVAENYAVREIPLYADIFYCFIPFRLQNWSMNSVWNWSEAIVRAYVLY